MHISINTAGQFSDEFNRAGRGAQFSYEALGLLFDYFEEVAPDMDLDVVAICCEYTEDTVENIAENYSLDIKDMSEYAQVEFVRDYLQDNTALVGETVDGFVYAAF